MFKGITRPMLEFTIHKDNDILSHNKQQKKLQQMREFIEIIGGVLKVKNIFYFKFLSLSIWKNLSNRSF